MQLRDRDRHLVRDDIVEVGANRVGSCDVRLAQSDARTDESSAAFPIFSVSSRYLWDASAIAATWRPKAPGDDQPRQVEHDVIARSANAELGTRSIRNPPSPGPGAHHLPHPRSGCDDVERILDRFPLRGGIGSTKLVRCRVHEKSQRWSPRWSGGRRKHRQHHRHRASNASTRQEQDHRSDPKREAACSSRRVAAAADRANDEVKVPKNGHGVAVVDRTSGSATRLTGSWSLRRQRDEQHEAASSRRLAAVGNGGGTCLKVRGGLRRLLVDSWASLGRNRTMTAPVGSGCEHEQHVHGSADGSTRTGQVRRRRSAPTEPPLNQADRRSPGADRTRSWRSSRPAPAHHSRSS